MKPIDLRNAAWADVLTHVTDDMIKVHNAWLQHGPGTTRAVAQRAKISLFTFRPRTTDLYKLGLVSLAATQGNEGIYAYVDHREALAAGHWRTRADFSRGEPEPTRVGFVTVEEAIASLPVAERAALGARLMAQYGHAAKRRETAAGGSQGTLAFA